MKSYNSDFIRSRLPFPVFFAQTFETRAKSGGDCSLFVGEKDALPNVKAFRDPARRAFAVERAVDLIFAVPAERAFYRALIKPAVRAEKRIGFGIFIAHLSK